MAKNIDAQIVFYTNPQNYESSGSFTMVLTYDVEGQEFTEESVIDDFFGSGTWEVNENILTTITDGEEGSGEIIDISPTNLKLRHYYNTQTSIQGYQVKYDIIFDMTLSRLAD